MVYRDVRGTITANTIARGAPQIFVDLGGMTILIRGKRPGEAPVAARPIRQFADFSSHDARGNGHAGLSPPVATHPRLLDIWWTAPAVLNEPDQRLYRVLVLTYFNPTRRRQYLHPRQKCGRVVQGQCRRALQRVILPCAIRHRLDRERQRAHVAFDAVRCSWCKRQFRPRSGGHAQRYCRSSCRRAFHGTARAWCSTPPPAAL